MKPAEVVPRFLNDPWAPALSSARRSNCGMERSTAFYGSASIHSETTGPESTVLRPRYSQWHAGRWARYKRCRGNGSAAVLPWRFVTFAGGCKRHGPARMIGATGATLTCLLSTDCDNTATHDGNVGGMPP